ncbi:fimbrial protein [Providencia rettgeri]|uniref:fimbrial protein n=1 Tax=Providencia rettgeri TaxID=587 RepID=UPI002480ADBD|nr:fimbrial protein [Providencia rettgeri]
MKKINSGQFLGFLMMLCAASFGDNNNTVQYEGTLISLPCTIDEGTPTVVEFGVIVDKQLYLHEKTSLKPFSIILQDCDVSIANTISLSVQGTAGNVTSDGYLMLNPSSTAKGVVIGLMDSSGKKIPMNSVLSPIAISNGTMAIQLNAFVKIESQNETKIIPGEFTAMLYYTLDFN